MSVEKKKEVLRLMMIGNNDSGKSTLVGRLLYEYGGLDEKLKEKFEQEVFDCGKGSLKFSWVFEQMHKDRNRMVSINPCKFDTNSFKVEILPPGNHRNFLRTMVSEYPDAVLLIVDSSRGRFEAGLSKSIEHACICRTFEIKDIIVCVNKMDDITTKYSESRFDEIHHEVSRELRKIGFSKRRIQFLPISSWIGDNVAIIPRSQTNNNMPWWKKGKTRNGGMSLLETIDSLNSNKKLSRHLPLRFCIQDVYKIRGLGIVPVGHVETGFIRSGHKIIISPENIITQVETIKNHHVPIEIGEVGANLGITLKKDKSNKNIITHKSFRRGSVIGSIFEDPPREALEFEARVFIIKSDHLINDGKKIKVGYTPFFDVHSAHIKCKITKFVEKYNLKGEMIRKEPEYLEKGDSALIRVKPLKPMVVERVDQYPSLGRFSVRDMRMTVMVGVVTKVWKKKNYKIFNWDDQDEKERMEYVKRKINKSDDDDDDDDDDEVEINNNRILNFVIRIGTLELEIAKNEINILKSFLML